MSIWRSEAAAPANRMKTVAIAGDSVTANNYSPSNPEVMSNHGYWTWADILSGHRVSFPRWNFGVGGDKSSDLLARIGAITAVRPDICVVEIAGNDLGTLTAAQSMANLTAIWDALEAAGVFVIACTIIPRRSPQTYNTEHKEKAAIINRFIRSQRYVRRGFEVADPVPYFMDYAVSDGTSLDGLQHDGLHPGQSGAFWFGVAVAEVIKTLAPPRDELFLDPADVWSASNPGGNLIANGLLTGTAGSKTNGATGDVATSWNAAISSSGAGMTLACSKEAHPTVQGIERQVLTVGGTLTANAQALFQQSLTYSASTGYQAGDTVEAMCEVEVSGVSNIAGVQLDIRNQDASNALKYAIDGSAYGSSYAPALQLPNGKDWSGILRTPPLVVPPNPANIRPRVLVTCWSGRTVAATVKVGRVLMRKVT